MITFIYNCDAVKSSSQSISQSFSQPDKQSVSHSISHCLHRPTSCLTLNWQSLTRRPFPCPLSESIYTSVTKRYSSKRNVSYIFVFFCIFPFPFQFSSRRLRQICTFSDPSVFGQDGRQIEMKEDLLPSCPPWPPLRVLPPSHHPQFYSEIVCTLFSSTLASMFSFPSLVYLFIYSFIFRGSVRQSGLDDGSALPLVHYDHLDRKKQVTLMICLIFLQAIYVFPISFLFSVFF